MSVTLAAKFPTQPFRTCYTAICYLVNRIFCQKSNDSPCTTSKLTAFHLIGHNRDGPVPAEILWSSVSISSRSISTGIKSPSKIKIYSVDWHSNIIALGREINDVDFIPLLRSVHLPSHYRTLYAPGHVFSSSRFIQDREIRANINSSATLLISLDITD